jgi:hypothetical protein
MRVRRLKPKPASAKPTKAKVAGLGHRTHRTGSEGETINGDQPRLIDLKSEDPARAIERHLADARRHDVLRTKANLL